MNQTKIWRCRVCGYIHEGEIPPDHCPVCGVPASEFEDVSSAQEPADPKDGKTSAWRCTVCGYIHTGNAPPDECPVCGAPARDFKTVEQEKDPGKPGHSSPADALIIAGAGIAGLSAAEAARETAPDTEIILLSAEEKPPYYRLNLTRYLAGEVNEDELPIHPMEWYRENRIGFQPGKRIEQLFAEEKSIGLSDGTRMEYDKLIIATGAAPFVPPIPGSELPHVHTLRTTDDANAILERIRNGLQVVCIGGGILGLETAGALSLQGANVTVLEASGHLMPRQLNAAGSAVLSRHLYTLNIDVITQAKAKTITPHKVELEDGAMIPADMVIIAAGVHADLRMFDDADLKVNRGVLVDNYMYTSNSSILAAGDACEHANMMYGSWSAAQFQGRIAGMNAAGAPTEFGGIPRSHTLKILGKDMFSIGTITPADGSLVQYEDEPDGSYRLFTTKDGILVGSLLIGDLSLMADCKKAIENKVRVDPATTPAEIAEAMQSS